MRIFQKFVVGISQKFVVGMTGEASAKGWVDSTENLPSLYGAHLPNLSYLPFGAMLKRSKKKKFKVDSSYDLKETCKSVI